MLNFYFWYTNLYLSPLTKKLSAGEECSNCSRCTVEVCQDNWSNEWSVVCCNVLKDGGSYAWIFCSHYFSLNKILLYAQTSNVCLHKDCLSFFSTFCINILQKMGASAHSLCYSAVIVMSVKVFSFTCRLCISYCKLAFCQKEWKFIDKSDGCNNFTALGP
jgi:hypothetical protein